MRIAATAAGIVLIALLPSAAALVSVPVPDALPQFLAPSPSPALAEADLVASATGTAAIPVLGGSLFVPVSIEYRTLEPAAVDALASDLAAFLPKAATDALYEAAGTAPPASPEPLAVLPAVPEVAPPLAPIPLPLLSPSAVYWVAPEPADVPSLAPEVPVFLPLLSPKTLDPAARLVATIRSLVPNLRVDDPSTGVAVGAAAGVAAGAGLFALLSALGKNRLLLAIPLYSRLNPKSLMSNRVREEILETIRARPGIYATELHDATSYGWGTVTYHLAVLEKNRLVTSVREGPRRRYFVAGAVDFRHREALALLNNATPRHLLRLLSERPGLIQREIGVELGLSPSTVNWHLSKLSAAGLVAMSPNGRGIRCFATPLYDELSGTTAPSPTVVPAAAA
ncbi:MAG: winged helix-turn-helix transcriptional regulator [Methanobacteriota archaeon]